MSTQSVPMQLSAKRAFAPWLLVPIVAFGLLSAGDRSVWSAGPGNTGIDPLQILDLSVRANAIFVLDSSGSMGETLTGKAMPADHPDAKLAIAKTVINSVVAANQTRVSFQFGKYTAGTTTLKTALTTLTVNGKTSFASSSRFQYTTLANPAFTTEPAVALRLYEVPAGSNWPVSFTNKVGATTTTYTTAALAPGVYTGTELAEHIAARMNAQHAASYTGTYSDPAASNSPAFSFTRTGGSGEFALRFSVMDATLRGLLRAVSTDSNVVVAPYTIQPHVGSFTTPATSAGPNSFTIPASQAVSVGSGVATTYYTSDGSAAKPYLTAGTYTGAQLATHIADTFQILDPNAKTTVQPNSFVITGSPQVRFRRKNTNFTGNLANGTYSGAALATLIANKANALDTSCTYSGAYDTTTGIFTFTRSKTASGNCSQTFGISWSAWDTTLLGQIGANSVDDLVSAGTSISTDGGIGITTSNYTYGGTYNSATGVFTFTRTGGTTTFAVGWANWTSALRSNIMGTPITTNATDATAPYSLASSGKLVATSSTTTTSTGPSNSTAPLALYRAAGSTTYKTVDGTNTYYHLFANKFFNATTLSVLADGTACYQTTGAQTSNVTVTIQRKLTCAGAVTDTVVFPLGGASTWSGAAGSCGGYNSLVSLAPCTENDQLSSIGPFLEKELSAPTGSMPGYVETPTGGLTTQPDYTGIRAAGSTPIAESLIDVRDIFTSTIWPVVSAQTKKQSTFVIFLTDGDDTCDDSSGNNLGTSADENALRAAHKAEMLYNRFVAGQPASSVTTFVVSLGSGASTTRSNWIAWGGSGMHITSTGTDTVASTRWNAIPTAAQRTACTTCRDAFVANDAAALTQALQTAIELGQSVGEFSDQQSITESVYEYVNLVPSPTPIASPSPTVQPSPYHPLDARTRYGSSIPVLLQSTFELPEYRGHLKAFRNNAGASELLWDAGAKLKTRVDGIAAAAPTPTPSPDPNAMGTGVYNFVTLYGNARTTPVKTSTARIKRRIFTTARQGVLSGYTAQNLLSASAATLAGPGTADPTRVSMWPPEAGVAPTAAVTGTASDVGSLDAALGLLTPTTVAGVQALVGVACKADSDGTLHAACNSATLSIKLAQARKEAREVLLAFIAGARVQVPDGSPSRDLATGELLYEARPWIMAESTLAAPAVVTPPLLSPTLNYKRTEYLLYRDGPRDTQNHAVNATANGLGLRNPDLENPQTTAARDNYALKPQMSVVYHATNQALHAFRAGPCPTTGVSGGFFSAGSLACAGETGGEELWAFVPFDQLGKLPATARVQSRTNKTYLLASPVRITDVFVSGGATLSAGGVNVSMTGVWRTLAVFGRGAGGKSLTAIDVTVPGPFMSHSLDTNPPIVVWSRGNFDTTDGLVKSASNSYVHDSADYTAYLGMGETWSVPAIGFVAPASHPTSRRPTGMEYAMYMGSGYSDSATEGKTFFVLDLLNGDVFRSFDIANGTTATLVSGSPLRNVLAASPAVYAVDDSGNSPAGFGFLSNPVEAKAKFVYFGDLHSRIWRYSVATPTVAPVVVADLSGDGDQPFANPLAVIEVGKVPNIFFSGGRDSRVNLRVAAPRFRMYGYSDATGSSPAGPVTQLFNRDFAYTYRGNSAPAAAFAGGDTDNDPTTPPVYTPIVFFTGLAAAPLVGEPCTSSFNSVLFALKGATGLAAFDLNSTSTLDQDDAFALITGQVLQTPHVTSEGTIVIDRGLGAQVAPPPPAPPVTIALPPQAESTSVVYPGLTPGTAAYAALRATTTPLRSGTSVCNVR